MKFVPTAIPDVVRIEPRIFEDARGFFMESFQRNKFREASIDADFVQENFSYSRQGVLRGLHYQIKHPQGKLVRVLKGAVYDVAVDMRRRSATFGKSVGAILSAAERTQLWIPPGFAHGFYVLSDGAEFLYKVTDYWAPEHERTLLWNDPELNIAWPVPAGQSPMLSPKDAAGLRLRDAPVYD